MTFIDGDPVERALENPAVIGDAVVIDDELGDAIALTDPMLPADIVWYVYRLDAPPAPGAKKIRPKYCRRYEGRLDLELLRVELGGGAYKVSGFVNNRPHTSGRIEIDGPARELAPAAPASAAPESSQEERLARIEAALGRISQAPTVAAPTSDLVSLVGMLKALDELRGGNSPAVAASELMEIWRQGVTDGQKQVRSSSGGFDWSAAIERAAPLVEKLLSRPRYVPGGPVAPGRPVPVGPEPPSRVLMFVDALAKGCTRRTHPGQLADAAEVLLSDDELASLRLLDFEGFMRELSPVLDQFPVLRARESEKYLGDFLVELKRDSNDGDEDGDDDTAQPVP